MIRHFTILALFLCAPMLASCGGSGGEAAQPALTLAYPARISGAINTPITTVTPTASATATYAVTAGTLPAGLSLDAATGAVSGTPTAVASPTTVTVTASSSGATATASFQVEVGLSADASETRLDGPTEVPVVDLSNPAPASGETITLTIARTGATAIALTASGPGCGAITSRTSSGASLVVTGAVASVGRCDLSATVTTAEGNTVYPGSFSVTPTNLSAAAGGIQFAGGAYFPSASTEAVAATSTVSVSAVSVPQSFINGGSGSIFLTASDPSAIRRAVVTLAGIPGQFVVPVIVDGGRLRIDLSISQTFLADLAAARVTPGDQSALGSRVPDVEYAARATGQQPADTVYQKASRPFTARALATATATSAVATTIRLVDTQGRSTTTSSASLNFQAVNAGSLQFSLSWDQPTDLDLHVVTPASGEIYYSRTSDGAGGRLDLDSNAGCTIDRVNNENVSWASGSPAPGRYIIRVDNWSACTVSTPANYRVTVTNCGVTTVYTGSFAPSTADRGGAGSGRTIADINYTACAGLSVSGRARYEDLAPTRAGLSPTPVGYPVRNAAVEVRSVAGDTLLGTGFTTESGNYTINFAMTTPGAYYVKLLAKDRAATPIQQVVDPAGAVYSARSANIDPSTAANARNTDILAKQSDGTGAAFNIYETGVNNFRQVVGQYGNAQLPALTWVWKSGVVACGNSAASASCYTGNGRILVSSASTNPDENDDSVLSHEFGHFVIRSLSVDRSPGGPHGLNARYAPLLGWSEGAATFWGQWSLASPLYIDTRPGGASFFFSTETPESFVPRGTSDGTLSGLLAETWIYAILWDLADANQDQAAATAAGIPGFADNVTSAANVFATLVALKGKTHDRGVAGPDLVDFLDQWLCSGYSGWNAAGVGDFRGMVVGLNQFPYAPDAPGGTPPVVQCT